MRAPKRLRRRRRPGAGMLRPLITIILSLLFVFFAAPASGAGIAPAGLGRFPLDGQAAGVFLRLETGAWSLKGLDWASLLRHEASLLNYMPAEAVDYVGPDGEREEGAVWEDRPAGGMLGAASGDPPLLEPLLPPPDETPGPSAAVTAPGGPGEDDRSWPAPRKNDPGARPLREVTLLPQAGGAYVADGSVFVSNDTGYEIDIPALLKKKSKLKKAKKDEPQILILHTHGSESFLPDSRNYYLPTDIERTEDTRYNVVRLGDEMERLFTEMGLSVIHDRDIHDYPTYNGSYGRSLQCANRYVKEYPSIQIVLDIHRDSITSKDGTMYKAVCETGRGKAAQMMFVAGSDKSGLQHDGWRDNLSLSTKLQQRLLRENPALMRPIHLRPERFNQHVRPGALILEVGTAGNTLDEALLSATLFCEITGPYLKKELGL